MVMTGVQVVSATEHRKAGDPVLRARDEKLESLKAVAGKLAHDFNNFLVPQFGYVTLLQEELPANCGGAEYLRAMETATRRTESYIDNLLLAMRPERHFSVAEFSLDSVLNELLDKLASDSSPTTPLEILPTIESGLPLMGDEKQWRNAINQLFANARYALATGGSLKVDLKRESLSSDEMLRLGLQTDDVYTLSVSDNGFGMSNAVALRAFEPFFTTRSQIKAPGLGLTIVHSIAQLHGGQVELTTAEGKGTTVTVWIPVNPSTMSFGAHARRRDSYSPAPKKKRVLLIEDNPLVKEVLRDWLGRMSLEVHVASDAEEAIEFLKRDQPDLALVITEADLKTSRGEDLYLALHESEDSEPAVPWIFLAGKRQPEILSDDADNQPAPMIMQKPVTLRALAEVVRRHTPR